MVTYQYGMYQYNGMHQYGAHQYGAHQSTTNSSSYNSFSSTSPGVTIAATASPLAPSAVRQVVACSSMSTTRCPEAAAATALTSPSKSNRSYSSSSRSSHLHRPHPNPCSSSRSSTLTSWPRSLRLAAIVSRWHSTPRRRHACSPPKAPTPPQHSSSCSRTKGKARV